MLTEPRITQYGTQLIFFQLKLPFNIFVELRFYEIYVPKLLRNSCLLSLQNGPKGLMLKTLDSSVMRPTYPTSIEIFNQQMSSCLSILDLFKMFCTSSNCFGKIQNQFSIWTRSKNIFQYCILIFQPFPN